MWRLTNGISNEPFSSFVSPWPLTHDFKVLCTKIVYFIIFAHMIGGDWRWLTEIFGSIQFKLTFGANIEGQDWPA